MTEEMMWFGNLPTPIEGKYNMRQYNFSIKNNTPTLIWNNGIYITYSG